MIMQKAYGIACHGMARSHIHTHIPISLFEKNDTLTYLCLSLAYRCMCKCIYIYICVCKGILMYSVMYCMVCASTLYHLNLQCLHRSFTRGLAGKTPSGWWLRGGNSSEIFGNQPTNQPSITDQLRFMCLMPQPGLPVMSLRAGYWRPKGIWLSSETNSS